MKKHPEASSPLQLTAIQKVAVVRALPGLGDLLCCVPTLRALRTAIPTAEITLIGLREAQGFVERFNHYVDRWLEFPGYPGLPEINPTPKAIAAFLVTVQQWNFDLVLQMHGNGLYMNSFVALLDAKQTAGFFLPGHYCPSQDYFLPYQEDESEVRRYLNLMKFLGITLQGEELDFPLYERDWQELETIANIYNLRRNYVCIHPGASIPARRWSDHNFAMIADALAAQGRQIVLTGTATEIELNQMVAQTMCFPAINLAGQTSLGSLAALLKQACLLICNDTGVSHLAAALQVSSVVIFSTSNPCRWAPLNRQRHRVVQVLPGEALACHHSSAFLDLVLQEAIALLQQDVAYVS